MTNEIYTKKQYELMGMWQRGELKRINLLEGSVRSGKTWISLVLWAFWVSEMPKDKPYLMVGRTMTTLKRNCLALLQELVGSKNFIFNVNTKEAVLFGRKIYLEGVSDSRAESKIRGMTLQGAYCDEVTLFSEEFFTMLLSRLSLTEAKMIATTNPDNPNHWLMKKYIKRKDEIDMLVLKFLIDDNTTLPKEYVKSLKAEYTGVYYERFILGQWKVAEGLIYGMFNPKHAVDESTIPEILRYWIGIDYGQSNATVFLLCGEGKDGRMYILDEYYHSGRDTQKNKSPYTYANDFIKFVKNYFKARNKIINIEAIFYDPSALGFKVQLSEAGVHGLKAANNEVITGIQLVSAMFEADLIRVVNKCTNFIDEIYSYSWDDRRAILGEDKPIKENDHTMDAFRYVCMGNFAYWKRRIGKGVIN